MRQVGYMREFLSEGKQKETSVSQQSSRHHANNNGLSLAAWTVPAGAIGVTFEERNGQCFVASIADDSILAGKIFINDILIAIDDVPITSLPVTSAMDLLRSRANAPRVLALLSKGAFSAAAKCVVENSKQASED